MNVQPVAKQPFVVKPTRLLFVEDEPKVAASVRQGLEENGYSVDLAPDGAVGCFLFEPGKYDLVLLDLLLPHVNGYDVCQHIRGKDAGVPIILLTALPSVDNKIAGFDAGADDYLVKPFDFRELLARIKVLLRRKRAVQDAPEELTLRVADLELQVADKTVSRQGIPISLTAKEFALLEFLMRRKGRVASRAEISEHVWDINFNTGTNVVEVYINFLRKKVDRHFTVKLIHTKPGMGYFIKDIG